MGKDLTKLIAKFIYFLNKLWYGECADCHVLLQLVKGWGRSDCPKCGQHFQNW
jgi:Zn finger protein HypA/HybF involved in hydrogenase expression